MRRDDTISARRRIPVMIAMGIAAAALGCGGIYHDRHEVPAGDISRSLMYLRGDLTIARNGTPRRDGRPVDPDAWSPFRLRRPVINRGGSTVLWLKTALPERRLKDPVLFFPAKSYSQDFDIYLGGERIFSLASRNREKDVRLFFLPLIIPLPNNYWDHTLYLRFQTGEPGPMGINSRVFLGSEMALVKRIIKSQADRLILGFIFLFSSLISLFIFLISRTARAHSVLAYSIMSASVGIFVILLSDLTILFFIDPPTAQLITVPAILFFPVGLFLFIDQTIGPGYKSVVRRSWQVFLGITLLSALSFATGIRPPMVFVLVGRGILLAIAILAAFAELLRAIVKGNRPARVISIGLIIFGASALADELTWHGAPHFDRAYLHWGFFIFILMLGYLLFRAFESAQRKLKRYSEELEEKSGILQELNRTLEEKVQERTEELLEKNTELNAKNRILEDRNREIDAEIAMARRIQQQLIPSRDPLSSICSLYRPMYQVGGDFYDFIRFDDGRMGFIISDVSGHGIPAALITSMLKMTMYQAGPRREDPASLFELLNEALFGQTGDNFITAFYGIIDFAGRSMVFCNAGHNDPFCISRGGISQICGEKTIPMAAFPNRSLEEIGKPFRNAVVSIPPASKILMYTDGLTEAVHPAATSVMFESVMPSVLDRIRDTDCRVSVDRLYGSLVEFRGGDSFEDDVCIVCVECP
ncbi:MAG: SpoIIE family protein phosphatase [Spirochaetes bacterium]|nr:SpoIIE family protein phosphatase [Spirochaetota bacterium]